MLNASQKCRVPRAEGEQSCLSACSGTSLGSHQAPVGSSSPRICIRILGVVLRQRAAQFLSRSVCEGAARKHQRPRETFRLLLPRRQLGEVFQTGGKISFVLKQLNPWRLAGRAGRPLAEPRSVARAVEKGVNLGKQFGKLSGCSVGGWLQPRPAEEKLPDLRLEMTLGLKISTLCVQTSFFRSFPRQSSAIFINFYSGEEPGGGTGWQHILVSLPSAVPGPVSEPLGCPRK